MLTVRVEIHTIGDSPAGIEATGVAGRVQTHQLMNDFAFEIVCGSEVGIQLLLQFN